MSAVYGIKPGIAKTMRVKKFPKPMTVKDVRAFIGLYSFFRRAIKNYLLISGPLKKLIRKDSGYNGGRLPVAAKLAFNSLKSALISRPCLATVNFKERFIVTTDASETHHASCLSQKGADGIERPCGCSSKLLSTKESKQQPGMRERAALLHALRHWQPYIIGKEFTLRTDHNPNQGKMKSYDPLTDEILQFMPFKLEFLNGNKMFVDALSRPPSLTCSSVDLGFGLSLSTSFDEQVIRTAQQKNKEFAKLFLLPKQVAPLGATTYQGLPTHLYNNLLCTFTKQGKRVLLETSPLYSSTSVRPSIVCIYVGWTKQRMDMSRYVD